MLKETNQQAKPRPFFIETADSLSDIETDHIQIEKVVKRQIGIYRIDPANGLIFINQNAQQSMLVNKQRAIVWKNWLLARYPAHLRTKLIPVSSKSNVLSFVTYPVPAYFVLLNMKTNEWTIGLTTDFAKQAPLAELLHQLEGFYGDEMGKLN